MDHLDEETVTRAGAGGRSRLPHAERAHLESCALCRGRVQDTARLSAVLREEEPEPEVPSFDALITPHLRERTEPVPVPTVSSGRAWWLTLLVTWRQARMVPRPLWLLTAGGFAALAVAVLLTPGRDLAVSAFLGPLTVALTTIAAVVVCDPKSDPRQESMYATLVPPVAVWLSRLTLVLGSVLLMAVAVSVLAIVSGSGQWVGPILVSWLSPALLSAGLATFGTVWRSPAVGLLLGAFSWVMVLFPERGNQVSTPLETTVTQIWTNPWVSLPLAVVALGGATLLVARPAYSLRDT